MFIVLGFPFALTAWLGAAIAFGATVATDLTELVRIEAGAFLMGSHDGPADERPQHRVFLEEYFIERTPVTNAQFARFLNSAGVKGPGDARWYDLDDSDARIRRQQGQLAADRGYENHPVVEASWSGALAYCRWAGRRLPTEAEWEKAARGTDGRKYPWGNNPPDRSRAQFGVPYNQTAMVGSFPKGASPYGLLDMAGNTWEWVSSAYLPYPYDASDGREDLIRPQVRGTRGGGHDSPGEELTTTHRGRHVSRNFRSGHHHIGFRCAR